MSAEWGSMMQNGLLRSAMNSYRWMEMQFTAVEAGAQTLNFQAGSKLSIVLEVQKRGRRPSQSFTCRDIHLPLLLAAVVFDPAELHEEKLSNGRWPDRLWILHPNMSGAVFPANIDIITLVRLFYLGSAAIILVVRASPPLRDRFLDYGARNDVSAQRSGGKGAATVRASSRTLQLLDFAATLQVSHSYFVSFYAISAVLCNLWLLDICLDGPARPALANLSKSMPPADPEDWWKPVLSLGLVLLHSIRRLYESLYISVPNPRSKMWVGHFAIGLAFFLVMPVAIMASYSTAPILLGRLSGAPLQLVVVSVATTSFLAASIWQYKYHAYLASLRKYTLPQKYGASLIVAPHYTADCLIFLSLAILNARNGIVDPNLLCVLGFVVINLGVTADGTKKWMLSKFREQQDDIRSRWRMLPGLW